jgi:jumonji domain-containing protein 2
MWTNRKYSRYPTGCAQFVRHMGLLHPEEKLPLTLAAARTAGWRAFKFEQRPGDLMVTWPGVYHSGVNLGLNVNEAAAIGVKNWVNGGKQFNPCTCEGTLVMDWSVVEAYL